MDSVTALKAALTGRLHLDLRKNPIRVRMDGGYLLIEGAVERVAEKKRALLVAMGLPSAGVIDRLRVRPASSMSDAEIKGHLRAAIESESALEAGKIRIEVDNGVVDLEGEVVSLSHKRLAGVLAWWVPGSTDVINSLEVVPPEEDNGDELRDAVVQALEKDRLVDASSISVAARDWTVTLEGAAGSEEEKAAAEDDAWFVWGVNDVVNNIKVSPGRHELP